MVRDFIVVQMFCNYCAKIKIASVLAQADIDLIDVHSGDPRVKIIERVFGGKTIYTPTGIVKNTLINSTRDTHWMYVLFGGKL